MSQITWERRHEALKAIWEKLDSVGFSEKGATTNFSLNATGDVQAPGSGKALKILAWYYYCSADIITELRFKQSGKLIAGLPSKGASAMNLVGRMPPMGQQNEPVEMYLSGAGTVKGWINTVEV